MQEFIHTLFYLIRVFPNQVDNSSCMEEMDEQHDQMDFYPSVQSPVNKSELSSLGLPMILRGLTQCQKGSSTSWFY
jgi:hypothetical protein